MKRAAGVRIYKDGSLVVDATAAKIAEFVRKRSREARDGCYSESTYVEARDIDVSAEARQLRRIIRTAVAEALAQVAVDILTGEHIER